jgi:hypothetical protein
MRRERHGERSNQDQAPGGFLHQDIADTQKAQAGPYRNRCEECAQGGFKYEGNES